MSDEMQPYVVRQGDYLTRLAWLHGFDAEAVWNHPKNAELKGRRSDHHVLAPGDILYIPEKSSEGLPIQKGSTNRYIAKVSKIEVAITIQQEGEPLRNEPYVIEGLAEPLSGQSDEQGVVKFVAPVRVREVKLVFHDRNIACPVRIGNMDPLEEASGVRQRLDHLGYYGWRLSESAERAADPARDRVALEAFQSAAQLDVTGVLDDATREALRKAHGR